MIGSAWTGQPVLLSLALHRSNVHLNRRIATVTHLKHKVGVRGHLVLCLENGCHLLPHKDEHVPKKENRLMNYDLSWNDCREPFKWEVKVKKYGTNSSTSNPNAANVLFSSTADWVQIVDHLSHCERQCILARRVFPTDNISPSSTFFFLASPSTIHLDTWKAWHFNGSNSHGARLRFLFALKVSFSFRFWMTNLSVYRTPFTCSPPIFLYAKQHTKTLLLCMPTQGHFPQSNLILLRGKKKASEGRRLLSFHALCDILMTSVFNMHKAISIFRPLTFCMLNRIAYGMPWVESVILKHLFFMFIAFWAKASSGGNVCVSFCCYVVL